jgi:DNA-directed RNA polymerase specialized sigma24 family protein
MRSMEAKIYRRVSFALSNSFYSMEGFAWLSARSMDQQKDPHRRFWIRNRNSLGNPIDQRWIEAANRVWDRARLVVIRYLADDTEAPEILEAAVDSASRVMGGRESIQFFDAYLLRSVAREAIRRYRRSQRLTYVDPTDLERLARPVSFDLDRKLDDANRIEILRACMDDQVRMMYDLRILEFSWRFIAKLMGYTDAHSAEVQFRKKIDKALERFRAHHTSRERPQRPERHKSE